MNDAELGRVRQGMERLKIVGSPDGPVRKKAIEDAIAAIQQDPKGALRERYIGVKNYASFGDQREDHPYGTGPRHGSIVFSIERARDARDAPSLGADEIFLLEAVRDFGGKLWEERGAGRHDRRHVNLTDVVRKFLRLTEEAQEMWGFISSATVDSHEAEQ